MDGVWATHRDGAIREMDIMIAQTMDGFRGILQIKDDTKVFDTLGNTTCLDTIWTAQPPVLDSPVDDPSERADDAGFKLRPGEEPRWVRDILSELMGVPLNVYTAAMQRWFRQHMFDHRISKEWWRPRYQNWEEYQALLGLDHEADGLEILAASAALRTHLNIQDEKIWNSCRNDFSEHDVKIVWSKAGAQLCDWPEPVPEHWETSGESSVEAPEPIQQVIRVLGGRLRVRDQKREYPAELGSPDRDDDFDKSLADLYMVTHRRKRQWRTPDFVAVKGKDLQVQTSQGFASRCA